MPEQQEIPKVIQDVFDFVFERAQRIYSKNGEIDHVLLAMEIQDGEITAVHPLPVIEEMVPIVRSIIGVMLSECPIVAHVFEAWISSNPAVMPFDDPGRKEALSLIIYTETSAFTSYSELIPASREIKRGDILIPGALGGRMAYHPPTTH